jgi:hypothetical protein
VVLRKAPLVFLSAAARDVLTRALADAERVGWKEGIALGRAALGGLRT